MIHVRIFDTRHEAERAQKILKDGGIDSKVSEDKLWGIPIQRFGVSARYRLLVEDKDYPKTVKYIAGKLKKKKIM